MEENKPVNVEMSEGKEKVNGTKERPRIKNVSANIDGRKVPLRMTTRAVIEIEEELDMTPDELLNALNELKRKNTRMVIKTLRILGNEGLRISGGEPDLTDDMLIEKIKSTELVMYRVGCIAAVEKGMFMETDDTSEKEQDVVLNEILKKNTGLQEDGSKATA